MVCTVKENMSYSLSAAAAGALSRLHSSNGALEGSFHSAGVGSPFSPPGANVLPEQLPTQITLHCLSQAKILPSENLVQVLPNAKASERGYCSSNGSKNGKSIRNTSANIKNNKDRRAASSIKPRRTEGRIFEAKVRSATASSSKTYRTSMCAASTTG